MEKRIPGGYFIGLSKKERQKYLGFEDKSAKEVHKMKDFKNFSESEIKNMFGTGVVFPYHTTFPRNFFHQRRKHFHQTQKRSGINR